MVTFAIACSSGPSIVRVAHDSACEIAWHRWEQAIVAEYAVCSAGCRYSAGIPGWRHGGTTAYSVHRHYHSCGGSTLLRVIPSEHKNVSEIVKRDVFTNRVTFVRNAERD